MATSRTSFMPARTLTRPEMASTADESWTWLSCRVFTASSSSFNMAAWSGGEEAILIAWCLMDTIGAVVTGKKEKCDDGGEIQGLG